MLKRVGSHTRRNNQHITFCCRVSTVCDPYRYVETHSINIGNEHLKGSVRMTTPPSFCLCYHTEIADAHLDFSNKTNNPKNIQALDVSAPERHHLLSHIERDI